MTTHTDKQHEDELDANKLFDLGHGVCIMHVSQAPAPGDTLMAQPMIRSRLIDTDKRRAWAHLPAYQRKAALESIRASANVRRTMANNPRGRGAAWSQQHEDRADALRIAAQALEAMALEVLRHDDA